MNNFRRMRHGVTMIEIIFVIIILGIVSSIGAKIITQTYKSYIMQRAQYRASVKTELALNQIANRLRYAIPGTVGFRASAAASFSRVTEANTGNDNVLQWVAYAGDSFETITSSTNRKPGWSGFCDIDGSTATNIKTPGSNLALADTIIKNLGSTNGLADTVLFFPTDDTSEYNVSTGSGESITLDNAIPSGNRIYERYKLAWSSYALSVEGGDLYLYYNFPPTAGATLGAKRSLLLKGVTNFRFKGSEGSLRVKICKREKIGSNTSATIHTCKEKVIF